MLTKAGNRIRIWNLHVKKGGKFMDKKTVIKYVLIFIAGLLVGFFIL